MPRSTCRSSAAANHVLWQQQTAVPKWQRPVPSQAGPKWPTATGPARFAFGAHRRTSAHVVKPVTLRRCRRPPHCRHAAQAMSARRSAAVKARNSSSSSSELNVSAAGPSTSTIGCAPVARINSSTRSAGAGDGPAPPDDLRLQHVCAGQMGWGRRTRTPSSDPNGRSGPVQAAALRRC